MTSLTAQQQVALKFNSFQFNPIQFWNDLKCRSDQVSNMFSLLAAAKPLPLFATAMPRIGVSPQSHCGRLTAAKLCKDMQLLMGNPTSLGLGARWFRGLALFESMIYQIYQQAPVPTDLAPVWAPAMSAASMLKTSRAKGRTIAQFKSLASTSNPKSHSYTPNSWLKQSSPVFRWHP